MKHSFVAEISAYVEISPEDFNFIYEAATQHYDYTVRASTEEGGFMYGMKGRRDWMLSKGSELSAEHLTFRNIDLMCKAIEFPATKKGWEITTKLVKVLNGINEKSKQINDWLEKGITEEDMQKFQNESNINEHQ